MSNGLKIGHDDVTRLVFDAPVVEHEYTMDFVEDWVVNPNNSEGITVTENTITITKVKPKVWFIKSNYGFASATERDAFFISKSFVLSGLEDLSGDSVGGITTIADNPTGDTSQTYYPTGLVISPINGDTLLSHVYPWDMGIPSGYFKHVYGRTQTWRDYGYGHDEEVIMYNNSCGYNNYSEVGIAFWTGVEGDVNDNGYLTLTTPVTISLKNLYHVDASTREGFKACVGTETVYLKQKTFANALLKYGMADEETGNYTDQIQGMTIAIIKSEWQNTHGPAGDAIAYVATERNVAALYDNYVFPKVEDITTLANEGFPMKFWAKQHDLSATNGFWKSVIDGFSAATITDPNYASCLFAKSDIRLASSQATVTLNFAREHARFILDKTFDYSSVENVVINISSGHITSLRDAFRHTTSLSSLSFEESGTGVVGIHTLNGAFEASALSTWPDGLQIVNNQTTALSELTCGTAYAFHNCALASIGEVSNDASAWDTILFDNTPVYAISASSITTINYILDMKFVNPASNAEYCLNVPNVTNARIKNLNKGDWSLDGTTRDGVCNGNLSSLNADSVNYLIDNLFDLRLNTSDASHLESKLNSFNDWDTPTAGSKYSTWWDVPSSGSMSATSVPSGELKLYIHGMEAGDVVGVRSSTTYYTEMTTDGTYSISVSGSVIIIVSLVNATHKVYIELADRFKAELTFGLSSATLYLPSSLSSSASSSSLAAAQEKGWTINFV